MVADIKSERGSSALLVQFGASHQAATAVIGTGRDNT